MAPAPVEGGGHLEISNVRKIFTALMLDRAPSPLRRRLSGPPARSSLATPTREEAEGAAGEELSMDRETFAHNLKRLFKSAVEKKVARAAAAAGDAARRRVGQENLSCVAGRARLRSRAFRARFIAAAFWDFLGVIFVC